MIPRFTPTDDDRTNWAVDRYPEIFEAGVKARKEGLSLFDCPYKEVAFERFSTPSAKARSWKCGWCDEDMNQMENP